MNRTTIEEWQPRLVRLHFVIWLRAFKVNTAILIVINELKTFFGRFASPSIPDHHDHKCAYDIEDWICECCVKQRKLGFLHCSGNFHLRLTFTRNLLIDVEIKINLHIQESPFHGTFVDNLDLGTISLKLQRH